MHRSAHRQPASQHPFCQFHQLQTLYNHSLEIDTIRAHSDCPLMERNIEFPQHLSYRVQYQLLLRNMEMGSEGSLQAPLLLGIDLTIQPSSSTEGRPKSFHRVHSRTLEKPVPPFLPIS